MSTMEDLRSGVGSNSLIVENIVSFCDLETKKSCRLVNSEWQTATNKHVWFQAGTKDRNAGRDEIHVALLEKPLIPFPKVRIYNVVQPQLLDYLGSSLKSLELSEVCFYSVAEMENVLFNNFPNMKNLILDTVGVEIQDNRVCSPRGAFCEQTPAKAQLNSLTIVIGDSYNWECGKEPGVFVLGLDTLFQKFNMVKKLRYKMGDYDDDRGVFAALSQARLAPPTLQFRTSLWGSDSMAEYLTTYGGHLLHVEGVIEDGDQGDFKNVNVGSWRSLRMDRADWNTFGRGKFENLLRLTILEERVTSFDFLRRMPALRELIFKYRHYDYYESEGMVTALDSNPPCKTVTKLNLRGYFTNNPELCFHVFPNATEVRLSWCSGEQLSELVNQWPMLNKLHLYTVKSSGVAEVTRNALRLEALENFWYGSDDLTFGDAEGEELLFHPKLTYLHLGKISMSPLMVKLLKRKLVEFEFRFLNEKECEGTNWWGHF